MNSNYKDSMDILNRQQRKMDAISYIFNQGKTDKKNQHTLNKILEQNRAARRDCYLPSGMADGISEGKWVKGTISPAMLDMINFEYDSCREFEDSFLIGGMEFAKSQIPSVSQDRALEIKAENNRLVLEEGKYYKFTDGDGKTHVLTCGKYHLTNPYSDNCRGIVDETGYRIGKFWSILSQDATYMALYYSHEEERQLLNNAGITEGFFTIQLGSRKQEYYYSNGNAGVSVAKWHYDDTYDMYMRGGGILSAYEVGSVFKIGGKEYVLSEEKKLDIPYGADIYDVEYPPKTCRVPGWH